ncbi:hypothetical protein [Bradyrhizobium sp. STM 3557]|uniref:hypothetical protein n=1 Tax=Bradyrhizobium sp. STM 3557 TaxID=578920 RepID=UPI00388F684B
MKTYRSGTVIVEAVQITDDTFDAPHPNPELVIGVIYDPIQRNARIETKTGTQIANIGDWIVKAPSGRLYCLGSDAFATFFKPVADT